VRAAGEVLLRTTRLLEEAGRHGQVAQLAVVGGARERNFGVVYAEGVGGAVLDQREYLDRLGARAPVRDEIGVAGRGDELAVRTCDSGRNPMTRLDNAAADRFDGGGHPRAGGHRGES
jgi:hypothetical protein